MSTPLESWVEESARLTKPSKIVWCDGSPSENDRLTADMLADGTFVELNQQTYPHCHLHRSNPNDVARTENLTFICTRQKSDAGPTNNWMAPAEAKEKVRPLFEGAMKGRTMYVVPYILGPVSSPYSKVGVEITDSAYVAASMRIMSRMGKPALDRLGNSDDFVPGLHSLADLDPKRRFILHFPEEKLIWSVGSGYGGNALLGKKCFALRIASWMAREDGWMAEHMLILGLEDPSGKVTYMAAAFPSACGKTNLAMMVSALETQGYRVWTVGDDIAWMHIASDGTLRAINPEAGFFGVAPGTNVKTNPNVIAARSSQHHFHQRRHDGEIPRALVGGHGRRAARWLDQLEGRAVEAGRRTCRASRTPATPFPLRNPPRFPITGKIPPAFQFRRSSSEAAARISLLWSTNRTIGSTEFSSARPWLRKPRLPQPARWALRAAIPWLCFRSAATTWPIISAIGSPWARS